MSSGKVHDWVTVLSLGPLFAATRFGLHWDLAAALTFTAGAAIGGLLLSPDLDTRSRPFYRWGPLRFIWWPYQWAIRHRSSLSHGLVVAPLLRLLYLSAVLTLAYFALSQYFHRQGSLITPRREVLWFVRSHLDGLLLLGAGIWLGGLLHVGLDFITSPRLPRSGRRRAFRR